MRSFFKQIALVLVLLAFVVPSSYAQEAAAGAESSESVGFDAKGAFSKILIAGLVGGILGLSTLSFYEKPNDHLRNITLGAGAAMIGTALYMTLSLASGSKSEGEQASIFEDFNNGYTLRPMLAQNFGGVSFRANF